MNSKFGRRKLLRGMLNGAAVSVGVPLLDCFLDTNGTALASGAPIPFRFGTWFWGLGHNPNRAIKPGEGTSYEFVDECMPLAPYKKDINFFSNFNIFLDGRPTVVHYSGWVTARTGTVPVGAPDITYPTLDVLVADAFGGASRFRSIEATATGNPRDSYSARNTASPNAAEADPVALYTRIFGADFADPNKADFKPDPEVMVRRSVLSGVKEQSDHFIRDLGTADKVRMDEYFTSVRQLEQQLDLQLQKPAPAEACVIPSKPAEGVVGTELETVLVNHKIMANLLAMAAACNQTRVFNMLYSQALSTLHRRGEAFIHHTLTHEEPFDTKLGYQAQVGWYNLRGMGAFADFIQAFASIKEGDGTLLDNTLIFANSDTSFAKLHLLDGIPVMTVGSAGGRLKTGMHIDGKGDPISRIGLTVQRALGLPADKWGSASMQTSKAISEVLV
jgi:hypothetical protein